MNLDKFENSMRIIFENTCTNKCYVNMLKKQFVYLNYTNSYACLTNKGNLNF